jgi:hypothetical protein
MATIGSSSSVDHWLFDHSTSRLCWGDRHRAVKTNRSWALSFSDTLCSFEGSGQHLRECEPLVPQHRGLGGITYGSEASPNCRRDSSTPESGSPLIPAKYLENSIASASIVSASCKGHPVDV